MILKTATALLLPLILSACGDKLPDCGDKEVTDLVTQQMVEASRNMAIATATSVFQSGPEWGQILNAVGQKAGTLLNTSEFQVLQLAKENKAPFKYSTEVKSLDIVLSNYRLEEEKKEPHIKLCAANFTIQAMVARTLDVTDLVALAKGSKPNEAVVSRLEQIEGVTEKPAPASADDNPTIKSYWEEVDMVIRGAKLLQNRALEADQTKNTVTETFHSGGSPIAPQKYSIQKTTDGKLFVDFKN